MSGRARRKTLEEEGRKDNMTVEEYRLETENWFCQNMVTKQTWKNYELRMQVLTSFGNRCEWCRFKDVEVLKICSIGRKKEKINSRTYKNILEGRGGYQLLCANCHVRKKFKEDHESEPNNELLRNRPVMTQIDLP